MVMENCIISNAHDCKAKNLRGLCTKPHEITDRKGESFPVCGVFGCRNEIQNAKTLFLADKPEYLRLGLSCARLRFTTESPAECEAVMARYCGQGDYVPADLTRGLFYRGVE
jgi:putative protease